MIKRQSLFATIAAVLTLAMIGAFRIVADAGSGAVSSELVSAPPDPVASIQATNTDGKTDRASQ